QPRGPGAGLAGLLPRRGLVERLARGNRLAPGHQDPNELGRGPRDEASLAQAATQVQRVANVALGLRRPPGDPMDLAPVAERAGQLPPRPQVAENRDGLVHWGERL